MLSDMTGASVVNLMAAGMRVPGDDDDDELNPEVAMIKAPQYDPTHDHTPSPFDALVCPPRLTAFGATWQVRP